MTAARVSCAGVSRCPRRAPSGSASGARRREVAAHSRARADARRGDARALELLNEETDFEALLSKYHKDPSETQVASPENGGPKESEVEEEEQFDENGIPIRLLNPDGGIRMESSPKLQKEKE